jgi:N-methylhydantoinase A
VLVPETPGAQCAAGLLMTDIRADFVRTRMTSLTGDAGERDIAGLFAELAEAAEEWLAEENVPPERRRTERWVEMRYAGQNYELPVQVPDGRVTAGTVAQLTKLFAAEHERMYGYSADDEAVQIVTFRLRAIGEVARAELHRAPLGDADPAAAVRTTREVYLPESGGFTPCPVYDRARLAPGHRVEGPAVIEQMDTTTLLLPGDVATVDGLRNLVVAVGR